MKTKKRKFKLWLLKYRITAPFRYLGKLSFRVFTVYRVAFLFILIAAAIWYFSTVTFDELLPNIIPELLSISITVFIIDTLSRQRSDKELKKVLISQLGSKNNAVTSEALKELDARGWLSDGTLKGAYISSANLEGNSFTGADLRNAHLSFSNLKKTTWFEADLQGAFLDHADLRGASLSVHAIGPHYAEGNLKNVYLSNSNLQEARVRHEQLIQTRSLRGTIMPDGKLYDGRYNLQSDIEFARKDGRDLGNAQSMASFYAVTTDEYKLGQKWFFEFQARALSEE